MNDIEIKRKVLGDLKQFARAEMARDLALRHGKTPPRFQWDPEDAPPDAPAEQGLDTEALQALAGHLGD